MRRGRFAVEHRPGRLAVAGALGGLALGAAARAAAQEPLDTMPDPCALLTRPDAVELLGEPVGAGRSYTTTPWNCVYRASSSDGLLWLMVQLGRGTELGSTQAGIELTGCGAEAVRRLEDLGEEAVLYHTPEGRCGESYGLWVATGVRFRGLTGPAAARPSEGTLHLLVVRYPPREPDDLLPVLRAAARRALARLAR